MEHVDTLRVISTIIVLFLGVGIHEYAHCKFADMAGDPTPSYFGRVTLNLTKHFEPFGTAMMVFTSLAGFGFGWGRPAPMDPSKMKNPRVDFFVAVAAGPISNLCQAVIYALLVRLAIAAPGVFGSVEVFEPVLNFLLLGVTINITLFLFNLLPLGPLDGQFLVGQLLPEKPRYYWLKFNRTVGRGIFVVLILGIQYFDRDVLMVPILKIAHLLLGNAI